MLYQAVCATRSFYIHWPFCPYRCDFCPFIALASHDQFMDSYHDALCKEFKRFFGQYEQKDQLETLFLGGGTPSTYPDRLILDMFGRLKDVLVFSEATEVTIEVNPGTVRVEQLALWKGIGINRLSIGVQSSKDSVLKKLNRQHSINDVYFLLRHAPTFFTNISVDLIVGLPGVSRNEWQLFLHEVITWPIQHISLYCLMLHEQTPLYFKCKEQKIILPKEDYVSSLYEWSIVFLKNNGFEQYEISNFARPGYQSRHNMVYWDRKPYKGFGLGACSFDGKRRFQNQVNLMRYMEALNNADDTTMFVEELTDEQVRLEKIMLGLRRSDGLLYATLFDELSEEKRDRLREKITFLKEHNFIREKNGRVLLTSAGLIVENTIIVQLSL